MQFRNGVEHAPAQPQRASAFKNADLDLYVCAVDMFLRKAPIEFVVTPPHLALCAIVRVLTCAHTVPLTDTSAAFTARLVQFCLRQRRDTTGLKLPSLNKLLTALQDAFGQDGIVIGNYCQEQISVGHPFGFALT